MLNIAIDGPSASGKGAVCRALSKKLSIKHMDTGAIYRMVALNVIQNKLDANNEESVKNSLKTLKINVEFDAKKGQLNFLNGKLVNDLIRSSEISLLASVVSKYLSVRKKIAKFQRNIARTNDIIIEGRDVTSFVLKKCKYKFFITASLEVRAERRRKDLVKSGEKVTLKNVIEDLRLRDERDISRDIHPLKITKGTILINTDNYSIEEVVNIIYNYVRSFK